MFELINGFDFAIVGWLNGFVGASVIADTIIWKFSELLLIKGGFMMALLWATWSMDRPDRPHRNATADIVKTFAGLVLAVLIGRALQLFLPHRARPLHDPALNFQPLENMPTSILDGWSAFPSDHAVLYAATAVAIFCRSRALGGLAVIWVLAIILFPRLYIGFHYPTDIIAGCAIGAALMALVICLPVPGPLLARLTRWRTRHEAWFQIVLFLLSFEAATLFDGSRSLARLFGRLLGLHL